MNQEERKKTLVKCNSIIVPHWWKMTTFATKDKNEAFVWTAITVKIVIWVVLKLAAYKNEFCVIL